MEAFHVLHVGDCYIKQINLGEELIRHRAEPFTEASDSESGIPEARKLFSVH
jgi:hypothetical protein